MQNGGPRTMEGVRLRVDLAYRGDEFHGWQRQPGGLRTVQGVLEAALERLIGHNGSPRAAGRTDAGVHARGQVCHLDTHNAAEAERVVRALWGLMPDDVLVRKVRAVSPVFDARFSATSRRYSYRILRARDLFEPFAWYVRPPLDPEAMNAAAACLRGEHDFSSFCKSASLRESNRCHVDLCFFDWAEDSAIFHLRADRFLHNMVRNLVGTLVEVGRGTRRPEDVSEILAARDRRAAGRRAPPTGLCLEEVTYPPELDDPGHRPAPWGGAGPETAG
jgi:tRNA pseudouridine38-40 synthase